MTNVFHLPAEDIGDVDFNANIIRVVHSWEGLSLRYNSPVTNNIDRKAYREELRARLSVAIVLLFRIVEGEKLVAENISSGFNIARNLRGPGVVLSLNSVVCPFDYMR